MEYTKPMKSSYSGNGWQGVNYEKYQHNIKEIARQLRQDIKKSYPECEFSVTIERYSMGQSLHIRLMSSKFDIFDESHNQDKNGNKYTYPIGNAGLNQYQLKYDYTDGYCNGEYLTPRAWEMFKHITNMANSYNFDDSDAQSDYSHTNFYLNLGVGKWDNPFKRI